ncbi:MAG: acetylxylan esterase [Acidobacteria bacterium]|nr:acetylxylan esterase [Acidobacteriota bacterium]
MTSLDRRDFVKAGFLGIAGAGAPEPDMLLDFLAGKLNALAARWDRERSRVRTAAETAERNRFVREKVREMIGPYPRRNALSPVVVRSQERRGYRVENVMYQSRPDFWVTGNLYIPEGQAPFPAIISPCGHYPLARMYPDYQFAYLSLVLSGFVVLAFDPIGQGERRQYWNPQTGEEEAGPTDEHSMPGQVMLLMGENLTHYRIWDGMRGIDYLLTRPEVDKNKIGCAGHSGGGTLTLFISAIDERVQCAVVNEGGTGHRWPMEIQPGSRVGPSDVEQNLFPAALHGADQCDLHQAIAPRPLLALIENYAPRFNRAAEHIRECYGRLGVPEKFATAEATDPHAWTVKLRLATADWFCRWFHGRPGPASEPAFEPEPPASLQCLPNGSLYYSRKGETVFTLLKKKQESLPPREALGDIAALIRFRRPSGPLDVRHLVTTPRKGYQVEKLEFVSEPGICIPAWVFVPERRAAARRTLLFASEAGKQAGGMELGLYEKLALQGHLVVSVDVRGIGETRPPHPPPPSGSAPFRHLFDTDTAMAYMAWYVDESLFGMRVQDVVRSVDYVLSRPDAGRDGLRVIGQGAGALWVLFAAALDARIPSDIAERGLLSYRTLAQTDRYAHGAGIFVRDVLNYLDLPQVAAAVAPRALMFLSPVDAMKRAVPVAAAQEAYRFTTQAYQSANAADRFRIAARADYAD